MQSFVKNNQQELLAKAAAQYEKAVEIYPEFLNYHFDLARIYEISGRYSEALVSYKTALQLDSTFSAEPYIALASIYFYQNNYVEAIKNFEKLLSLNVESVELYNTLAECYFKLGNFENAIQTLKTAQKKYPQNIDITLNLGQTYLQQNRKDEALVEFIKAQNLNGDIQELNQLIEELENSR